MFQGSGGSGGVSMRGALVGAALLVSGCATVAPETAETAPAAEPGDDRRSRAEQVFLYQSRVADALLDRYPLLDVLRTADPEIVAAEARMTEACGPLTEAVVTRLEGRDPPLVLHLEVLYTTGECERAARRIEQLLRAADAADAAGVPSI